MRPMNARPLLIAILAGVCVSLACVVVWQKQQLDRKAEAPGGPPMLPPAVSPIGAPPDEAATARRTAEAAEPVAAAPMPPSEPAAAGPSQDPSAGAEKPAAQQFMAALAKMVQDPKMKEALRGQQRMAVDMGYGQLFKCLTSRPETVTAFKNLLMERQMAMMDLGLGVVAATTKEQRAADAQKVQAMQKDFDSRAQSLLGAEDFALYKDYEDTQPERMQVTAFGQSLGGADALTEAQQHELIRAMYEERSAFKFSVPTDVGSDPSAMLATGAASRHVSELKVLQTKYMDRASSILTPAQAEAFRASQEQQAKMQEMGIQIGVQMMGAPAEEGK